MRPVNLSEFTNKKVGEVSAGSKSFSIIQLSEGELNKFLEIRQFVLPLIERSTFHMDPPDFFRQVIRSGGQIFVIIDNQFNFVAYVVLAHAAPNDVLLKECKKRFATACDRTTYIDSVFVMPTHRRLGLMRTILNFAERFDDGCTALMATVAPGNWTSIKSFFERQFAAINLVKMYEGVDRYILCKNLMQKNDLANPNLWIPSNDLAVQTKLFAEGAIAAAFLNNQLGFSKSQHDR